MVFYMFTIPFLIPLYIIGLFIVLPIMVIKEIVKKWKEEDDDDKK